MTTSTPINYLTSSVTITTESPISVSDHINTTPCNDHAYRKENPGSNKKTPVHKAKLREQHDSRVNLLVEYIKKSDSDDFMIDSEFSDTLGQIPQRSRQNFIS